MIAYCKDSVNYVPIPSQYLIIVYLQLCVSVCVRARICNSECVSVSVCVRPPKGSRGCLMSTPPPVWNLRAVI